jgi:hypothetical protein
MNKGMAGRFPATRPGEPHITSVQKYPVLGLALYPQ